MPVSLSRGCSASLMWIAMVPTVLSAAPIGDTPLGCTHVKGTQTIGFNVLVMFVGHTIDGARIVSSAMLEKKKFAASTIYFFVLFLLGFLCHFVFHVGPRPLPGSLSHMCRRSQLRHRWRATGDLLMSSEGGREDGQSLKKRSVHS